MLPKMQPPRPKTPGLGSFSRRITHLEIKRSLARSASKELNLCFQIDVPCLHIGLEFFQFQKPADPGVRRSCELARCQAARNLCFKTLLQQLVYQHASKVAHLLHCRQPFEFIQASQDVPARHVARDSEPVVSNTWSSSADPEIRGAAVRVASHATAEELLQSTW